MRVARTTLAALLLLALPACPSNDGRSPNPGGGTTATGVRGGELRVLMSEDVDSLDPQRAGAPPSFGVMRAVHRGLMAFPASPSPAGGRPVPDLAASEPEVSADGLRYTFRLRDGAAFGPPASRPVDALDVKAGLERIFTVRSPVAAYFHVIAGADARAAGRAPGLSGVTTPDDRTVVIALARPATDLPWLLALPAASAVPAGLSATPRPDQIAASGPYRLAPSDGYRPERGIHLVRNDAWDEASDPVRRAWVDEITIQIGFDAAEIQRRIVSGAADLSGDVAPAAPVPVAASERLVRAPNGCLRYLFMNTREAPFSSGRVRIAVAVALDRGAVQKATASASVPAGTILPPTVDGHDPSRTAPAADAAAARRILAPTKYRNGFATRLVVGDRPADRAEAAAVARALGRAGIRVAVTAVPIASLYEDRYERPTARVPMGIATWCADWPGLGGRGALTPLVDGRSGAVTNYAGISNGALNRALDAVATLRDPARAAEVWRIADGRAVGLAAVVPLVHVVETSLLGPRVRGFVAHPFFVRGDLTAVWLQTSG